MANDPERERELRLLEEEAERLDHDFEHLADQWEWVHQRIQHLKRERRPQLRVLRGGALGAVGTVAGMAWHKAATHPGTASGVLVALAIASATPFVVDDPRPDTPSVAIPAPPSMNPPGLPPMMPSAPQGEPSEPETQRSLPPGVGNDVPGDEPTTVPRPPHPVPVAVIEPTAEPSQPSPAPPEPPQEQPSGNERNESDPPAEEPPEPEPKQPPDCTGIHADLSPVAEACLLGEDVASIDVLG